MPFSQLSHATEDSTAQLALASSLVGLIYYHHALSRADLSHIHQVIQPFLVTVAAGLLTFLPLSFALIGMALIFGTSLAILWKTPAFAECWAPQIQNMATWTNGTDTFLVADGLRKALTKQQHVIETHSSLQDRLFVAPASPALLALFHRRTATYDTFPVYPASKAAQDQMLAQLKASVPPVAIISRGAIDGREDLRFASNYARVFEYFRSRYDLQSKTSKGDIFVHKKQKSEIGQADKAGQATRHLGVAAMRCSALNVEQFPSPAPARVRRAPAVSMPANCGTPSRPWMCRSV